MAGYLGSTPVPQATQHRESFTATAAQTTFATAGYTVGFVDVYLNGVHLTAADVTATNGSDVVLGACLVNDIVDVISHSAFEVNAQVFTGVTSFADGSAGAPSITNTGDVNTGIFFPAADTIAFAEGGAEAMRIDSGGHVGIGTASPNIANFGKAFTINDPASSNQIPAIELAYGSNTRGANIAVDNRSSVKALAITAVASDLSITFGTNNTERMRIDTTGAVTKPLQPAFHVNNAAGLTDNITIGTGFKTISMGTEVYDTTNNFANDVFTAPVTGKYQMNVQLLISTMDSASTYIVFDCTTSNRNYHYIIYPTISITADGTQQIVWSFVADMDAGDTSYLRAIQSGGTAQADVQSDANYTRWTGYLLG